MSLDRIRVMIVDDHAVVREGIAALLAMQAALQVVAEAGDGEEAVELHRRYRPQVTLLDLRLPKLDGPEVIRRVRAEAPDARFLVLTTYDGDEQVQGALQAGARGYLLKGASRREVVQAIEIVHAGRRYLTPEIVQRLTEWNDSPLLTQREGEVLRLVADGLDNVALGRRLGITESTVKAHMNRILAKLDATDRTQALIVAIKRGLIRIE